MGCAWFEPAAATVVRLKIVARWFSVTKLDDRRKFFATNYLTKVAQIFGDFLGYLEKHHV